MYQLSKMAQTCKLAAKRYIVLKCSKVSTRKPIEKQGKVVNMKCSGKAVAQKFAAATLKKRGRKVSKVFVYRKGKVTKYTITFRASKKTGKQVVVAKKASVKTLKKSPRAKPCKPCSGGSRKSRSGKSCQDNKKVLARKTRSAKKAKTAAKRASKKVSRASKKVVKSKKSALKTKAGSKSRKAATKRVVKAKSALKSARKSLRTAKKTLVKRRSALRAVKKTRSPSKSKSASKSKKSASK